MTMPGQITGKAQSGFPLGLEWNYLHLKYMTAGRRVATGMKSGYSSGKDWEKWVDMGRQTPGWAAEVRETKRKHNTQFFLCHCA